MEIGTYPDYGQEGRRIDVRLLHALALGGLRSVDLQSLLAAEQISYQKLALRLTDLSVTEDQARVTFGRLQEHQARMCASLGRPVGIMTASMDYLENIERALGLEADSAHALTYRQLSEMAFRDRLTGLANYGYFEQRFAEETKRVGRYRRVLSLLTLDLDHFKNLNDTYGHLAGNRALEHIARLLRSGARETDFVARCGGDEFALIMPETTKHDAQLVAERICRQVESSRVELPDSGLQQLTISAGLATYPRDVSSAEMLLVSSDQALYAAKAAGRNCVKTFTPPGVAHFAYTPDDKGAVKSMSVAGDFNGWSMTADQMSSDSRGLFRLDLNLAPGTYVYKFVIDGNHYTIDPRCSTTVPDGYGGFNSVLVVV